MARMVSPYTRDEAIELLASYKACERAIVDGTAKEYRIGSRAYTALDLTEIRKRINELAALADALRTGRRMTRTAIVVPRDL